MAAVNRRLLLEAWIFFFLRMDVFQRRRRRERQRTHRFCVREIFQKREDLGAYHTLVRVLRKKGLIDLLHFSTNSFTRKKNQFIEGEHPKVPAHHTRDT